MRKVETAGPKADLFGSQSAVRAPARVYTVSQLTQDIKLILEETFGQVWVEGEVSNFRPSQAGHYYFSLKDQSSMLAAVIFSRASQNIAFKIEDGLKVICHGSIEVYPPRGQYQIIVDAIEPKGVGSLQLALEQLKAKLEKEGLFAPEHKRPLPYLPFRIGVVTSLQGAAIKDILKVLDRRFKEVHIIVSPVKVQGDGAKEEIAQAINDFNAFNQKVPPDERIDVMIVGRGGGSIEDLWAFNEEVVARAIYRSRIPVISAVGHERDWTIADLVADVRAPTPSVAAELVIPKKEDLTEKLHTLVSDLRRALEEIALDLGEQLDRMLHRLNLSADHVLELSAGAFDTLVKKLQLLNPAVRIRLYREKIFAATGAMQTALKHFIALREASVRGAAVRLNGLSPLNILSRGYSITFTVPEGKTLKDAAEVTPGQRISTRLRNGTVTSTITEVTPDA